MSPLLVSQNERRRISERSYTFDDRGASFIDRLRSIVRPCRERISTVLCHESAFPIDFEDKLETRIGSAQLQANGAQSGANTVHEIQYRLRAEQP